MMRRIGSLLAHDRATGFLIMCSVVLSLFLTLYLLGDRPVWTGQWSHEYTAEVCPSLLAADPYAVERIDAAYGHVEDAGRLGPSEVYVGDCLGPVVGVRWDVGTPAPGRVGETRQEHIDGVMQSASVTLDRERLAPDLYRHEAWHTIGADHPWLPSTDHVLHPGGEGHVWGTATRGYEVAP